MAGEIERLARVGGQPAGPGGNLRVDRMRAWAERHGRPWVEVESLMAEGGQALRSYMARHEARHESRGAR